MRRPERRRTRRVLFAAALALAATACRGTAPVPAAGARLVIVGVDGAAWSLLSPMMQEGRLPNLARLYRAGSAGALRSPQPPEASFAPAALWTSLVTGRSPATHGIRRALEKIPGSYDVRPVTADRRRAASLWTIASSRGLTVGLSGIPVTFPAESVNGFLIAQGYEPSITGDAGYLHPEGALGTGSRRGEEMAWSGETERIASLDPALRRAFEEDLSTLARGAFLYRVYRPRLALFRFGSLDLAGHRFWQYHDRRYLDVAASRGMPVAGPQRSAQLAEAIPGACRFLDEWIGLLLERLPEEATLMIVSPSGLRGAEPTDFLEPDINRILELLGHQVTGPSGSVDWSRSEAFVLEGGGGAVGEIHLNVAGREQAGVVSASEAQELGGRIAAELRDLASPAGERLFRAVELDAADPDQPVVRVVRQPGIDPAQTIRVGRADVPVVELYVRGRDDLGVHAESGILLAAGRGIAAGRTGWSAGLYDVAPTALYLLGLPLASEMPGRPIEPILQEPVAADHPRVDSYAGLPAAPAPRRRPAPLVQRELDGLRELGHLDGPARQAAGSSRRGPVRSP